MANNIKDPRANMISENGVFLDWCGDDTRYYYNGSYLDLCGMSPEEYMKNWSCCDGDDNGDNEGDVPTNPRENPIILSQSPTVTETGEPAVMLMAKASKPTASDVTVTITYDYIDDETEEIKTGEVDVVIPAGETEGRVMMMMPRRSVSISSTTHRPESDEHFDYSTEGDIARAIGCLFHGVYPTTGDNEGITVGLENIIKDVTYLDGDTYNTVVSVPYKQVNEKLSDEVLDANLMDMVFAIDADIENFTMTDSFGSDYTSQAKFVKTIAVDAPDENNNLYTAFYKVYRYKNNQLVNVGRKPKGSPAPFEIKIKKL